MKVTQCLNVLGRVQDNMVEVARMVPPLEGCTPQELRSIAQQTLIPVDVEGDRQYFLSLRHGHLVDKARLMAILQGKDGLQDSRLREVPEKEEELSD